MYNSEFEPIDIKEKLTLIKVVTNYALEYSNNEWIGGRFYNDHLSSLFQPLFSPAKKKVIGHASYVGSVNNKGVAISPWHEFALALKDEQLIEMNHLCQAVHALNYFYKADTRQSLLITLHPRLLESTKDDSGRMLENILSLINVHPSRVIIEIPSLINRNWKLLRRLIFNYRFRGYQVAVSYSRTNNDWMTKLVNFYPDIVCIQAIDLLRHQSAKLLADTIHQFGAVLSVKDIETSEQSAVALDAGADFMHGDYFGKTERAVNNNLPPNLTEKINTNRWRRHIASVYQRYNEMSAII